MRPAFTDFQNNVQPVLNGKTCGNANCHEAAANNGQITLITTAPNATQVQANFDNLACSGPLDTFAPASGNLVDYFCTYAQDGPANATGPSAINHNAQGFTTAECVALITWIETGGAGNNLPVCVQ